MMKSDTYNPLLHLQPHQPIDFTTIIERKGMDFLPTLEHYEKLAKERIQKIKNNPEVPDFNNTILALEVAPQELFEVHSIFQVLFNAECIEEIQAIAQEVSTFLARFSNDVFLDEELFQKVDYVYQTKKGVQNKEQERLLQYYWNQFKRNGALLPPDQKQQLRQIDEELAKLSPKFSENVLKATNAFELHLTSEEDLKGLPEFLKEKGKENAKKRNKEGYVFTLQFPEYLPFLTYAEKEELRKKLYLAYRSRALQENFDNRPIIKRILELREKRAKLLGYQNHAEYVLEERMAKTPNNVFEFLEKLYQYVYSKAKEELQELELWVKKNFPEKEKLHPWDYRFYSEKYKKELFQLDQEALRPYFSLENVIEGIFLVANKLYGLSFQRNENIPVYHPEVQVYEVYDEDKKFLGLFYFDLFPRETKRSGAWMTTIREQGLFFDEVIRPHVGIVCNFTRPTETKPSLLTLEEVETLFHEFGHALHGLFSNVTYRSLAGTNVYWDFVELPSQIMENWLREKETLDLFARHYQTKEPIPQEILNNIKKSETFHAGIQFLTQLQYGFLDMYFHTTPYEEITDIQEFERKVTEKTRLFEEPKELCIATSFSHIFAGGYSAGYYSYKWAEVLEADAYQFFKEQGIFNRDVATRFRKTILEKGNTEDPLVLYVQFRGREPQVESLLKKFELLKEDTRMAG
ncbi:MAG: M3 family metallopeptidase [Leptospiraceae bacterium]|nr:M3 family metallopeptidase [Leptospiraceae bacterium]MDW7976715.1 M3 family metallopeptidase [Leptospiraceae bacterium]